VDLIPVWRLDSARVAPWRVQEKTLVLASAPNSSDNSTHHSYAIVLRGIGAQYVDLDDRSAIARKAPASLFISSMADTLSEDATVSGSTVYTVSDRVPMQKCSYCGRENAAAGPCSRGAGQSRRCRTDSVWI